MIEEIKDIGTIEYIKSTKAKRINIRVKPDGIIRVAVPRGATIKEARKFILIKKEWIKKITDKIDNRQKNAFISPDESFKTHYHTFIFERDDIDNVKILIDNGIVQVKFPQNIDSNNKRLQEIFREAYIEVLRKEAKYYLPKRIHTLAEQHGFKYNDLRIKNVKTRWGSCSNRNNINLNLHIMKLPIRLIDYIILHELTHTIHKNHGPNFHKHLEKVCPNAKLLEKEIRGYDIFKE